jgi:hypothetical protein
VLFDQGEEGGAILDAIVAEGRCRTCGTRWDHVVNVDCDPPVKIEGDSLSKCASWSTGEARMAVMERQQGDPPVVMGRLRFPPQPGVTCFRKPNVVGFPTVSGEVRRAQSLGDVVSLFGWRNRRMNSAPSRLVSEMRRRSAVSVTNGTGMARAPSRSIARIEPA